MVDLMPQSTWLTTLQTFPDSSIPKYHDEKKMTALQKNCLPQLSPVVT